MRLAIASALIAALTSAQIERAQQVARSRDSERAQFHGKYVFSPASDTVTRIEVITEFRRLVIITQDRLLAGDQMFSRGVRQAEEALAPKRGKLTLKAQLRFHPQNAYSTVPAFKLALGSSVIRGPLVELDTTVTAESAPGPRNPGRPVTFAGAVLEADALAAQIGQATMPVGVLLEGKELARTSIDFARLD